MRFISNPILWIGLVLLVCGCSPNQPILPSNNTAAVQASTVEPAPLWLSVPVVDAKTGKSFTVADLKGKVVLIEGMATWCPSCWAQGREIKKLYNLLGKDTDLTIISLALDSKEDAQTLNDYAKIDGFEWVFATSSLPMFHDIGNRYGALYLDPTLGPFLVVDRKGYVTHFESGLKTAAELKNILDPMLNGG
jgi:cytochrome oxidase Cu insertion factor (SCO1/SenC/PrrC family)